MREIRLIDLGVLSALQSQVVYHAISVGVSTDQPDTLALNMPSQRCVSIGSYQECSKDIDTEFCRQHGIPIYRSCSRPYSIGNAPSARPRESTRTFCTCLSKRIGRAASMRTISR